MTTELHPGLSAQLTEMQKKLDWITNLLACPREVREFYTVEEAAEKIGRKPYTVREWCRHGRINASKRIERRGGAELWSIPADELTRYRNDGLLQPETSRNAGR